MSTTNSDLTRFSMYGIKKQLID